MNRRLLSPSFAVALVILLASAWITEAQAPGPHEPLPSLASHPFSAPGSRLSAPLSESAEPDWPEVGRPFPPTVLDGATSPQGATSPAMGLGQPGVAYRYVQTWGDPNVPYFEDTILLNTPVGIGVDGNNVWIAEAAGRRLMKYTNSGTFVKQIGHGGLRYAIPDVEIKSFSDVAVDAGGNIWATDEACHVLRFDSTGQYLSQLFGNWHCGEGNDRFSGAYGLAFDTAGRLYVSDIWNHRVQVLQPDGTYVTTIGVTGVSGADDAHFNEPRRITIDANNRLYVADSANHRVQVFDVSALPVVTHLATLGVAGVPGNDSAHLNRPYGVATDIGRNRIYVADKDNQRIQVFDYATRAFVATISDSTGPSDVAVDAAGNVYAAASWGWVHTVRQYSPAYALTRTYGVEGEAYLTDANHFFHPNAVAVDLNGSLYIGEGEGRRLTKRTAAGALQWSIGVPGVLRDDNTGFDGIGGLDLDSAGWVYAADAGNHRVQIFTANGGYVATLGGSSGQGPYEFNSPSSVAVGPGDMIYVADTGNHRVQVYNSSQQYVATIGETGVCGSSNSQFCEPRSVDVDAAGSIYVADTNNHRVQVFDANRNYVRTIGVTGANDRDFGNLPYPLAVVVGANGRTFVGLGWWSRVDVFDASGAYLTSVGPVEPGNGLALDTAGNLYVAQSEYHRVQKFAAGVPGWRQANINGFGDIHNEAVSYSAAFGDYLYTATMNHNAGGEVWRSANGTSWTQVNTDGFGNVANWVAQVSDATAGHLYVGTGNDDTGGEIWRCGTCDGTDWARVVSDGLGDSDNQVVQRVVSFDNALYATVDNGVTGVEVWRSLTGNPDTWTQCNSDGFGDNRNKGLWAAAVYNGYLYVATTQGGDDANGVEVWRTNNGTTWNQVNIDGFGDPANSNPGLEPFGGQLYLSSANGNTGVQIRRCSLCDGTDWSPVVTDGFGDVHNRGIEEILGLGGQLYAATGNSDTGSEVWRTADGVHWSQANIDGFGDSNNQSTWGSAVFSGRLFLGTLNYANGGEMWQLLESRYLPLIVR